ncbi:glycoside hydrolase family protein [Acidobacteriota bacterium]
MFRIFRKYIFSILVYFIVILTLISCSYDRENENSPQFFLEPIAGDYSAHEGQISINSTAILQDPDNFVWGGSVIEGDDGLFYMFYSIFDSGPDKPNFSDAWLLSSRIACAVSRYPDKGFEFMKVILEGRRHIGQADAWDSQGVHNPHIQKFNDKYYLYYIGSRDPGPQPQDSPGASLRKRDRIQQVQKIGVIEFTRLEDLITGNFERPEIPLLSPRTRVKSVNVIDPSPPGIQAKPDNLIVVNPSVVYRPFDQKYLLYFKGNLYDPGWRGVHGVAIGDSPLGPFQALDDFVFDVRIEDGRIASAEDPYVWYHNPSRLFYAVIKDFSGRITGAAPGLAILKSTDGIDWMVLEYPVFSLKQLVFKNGSILPVSNLERPQLLIDDAGNPTAFYAACSVEAVGGKTDGSTFNVQMKVRIEALKR